MYMCNCDGILFVSDQFFMILISLWKFIIIQSLSVLSWHKIASILDFDNKFEGSSLIFGWEFYPPSIPIFLQWVVGFFFYHVHVFCQYLIVCLGTAFCINICCFSKYTDFLLSFFYFDNVFFVFLIITPTVI